ASMPIPTKPSRQEHTTASPENASSSRRVFLQKRPAESRAILPTAIGLPRSETPFRSLRGGGCRRSNPGKSTQPHRPRMLHRPAASCYNSLGPNPGASRPPPFAEHASKSQREYSDAAAVEAAISELIHKRRVCDVF